MRYFRPILSPDFAMTLRSTKFQREQRTSPDSYWNWFCFSPSNGGKMVEKCMEHGSGWEKVSKTGAMFSVGNHIQSRIRMERRLVSIGEARSIFDSNHYVGKASPSGNHPSTFYPVGHQNEENANLSASEIKAPTCKTPSKTNRTSEVFSITKTIIRFYKSFFHSKKKTQIPYCENEHLAHFNSPIAFHDVTISAANLPMAFPISSNKPRRFALQVHRCFSSSDLLEVVRPYGEFRWRSLQKK